MRSLSPLLATAVFSSLVALSAHAELGDDPDVSGVVEVTARGPGPLVYNTASINESPGRIAPPITAVKHLPMGPPSGKSGGGARLNLDIGAGTLAVASCSAAATGTGEGFIGDGNSYILHSDTFDVNSASLPAGTEVPLTFRYGALADRYATHSFGNVPAAFHARATALLNVAIQTTAASQNSFSEYSSHTKYSYDPNPATTGIFSEATPIVDVALMARVGGQVHIEIIIEADTVADVLYVGNDGSASMTASTIFGFEESSDFTLISRFTNGEPVEVSEITHYNIDDALLPFPDPYAVPVEVPALGGSGAAALGIGLLFAGAARLGKR